MPRIPRVCKNIDGALCQPRAQQASWCVCVCVCARTATQIARRRSFFGLGGLTNHITCACSFVDDGNWQTRTYASASNGRKHPFSTIGLGGNTHLDTKRHTVLFHGRRRCSKCWHLRRSAKTRGQREADFFRHDAAEDRPPRLKLIATLSKTRAPKVGT